MQQLTGFREKKQPEPQKEVSHADFMLNEMQDMALDFHQETYYKRYMLTRLAYEAQHKAIKIIKAKQTTPLEISGPNMRQEAPMEPQFPEVNDAFHNPLDLQMPGGEEDVGEEAPNLDMDALWDNDGNKDDTFASPKPKKKEAAPVKMEELPSAFSAQEMVGQDFAVPAKIEEELFIRQDDILADD